MKSICSSSSDPKKAIIQVRRNGYIAFYKPTRFSWKRFVNIWLECNHIGGKSYSAPSSAGFRQEIWEQVDIMNLRAAGTDQGGIHNPIVENPASGLPATNENRKSDVRIAEVTYAVETESERNEGLCQGNAESHRGQDE
jgi:hypothetical protein